MSTAALDDLESRAQIRVRQHLVSASDPEGHRATSFRVPRTACEGKRGRGRHDICQTQLMSVIKWRSWWPRIAWGCGGAAIGAGVVFTTNVADRLDLPGKWDPSSKISVDTLGTWLGAIATIAIAIVGGLFARKVRLRQERVLREQVARTKLYEAQRRESAALLSAYDVKFRVRLGSVDRSGYYNTWLVTMTTSTTAAALDAQVFYEGKPLGDSLDRIPHRENWWVWTTPGDMDLSPATKNELTARQRVKQVVRHAVEVHFSVDEFRFARTTKGITIIGRPAVAAEPAS
ncbi:hypothetical protein FHR77_002763 [Frigoribacterium endophyticum]|nr:hypothetical protein [Frigoribacterium endophyticum]